MFVAVSWNMVVEVSQLRVCVNSHQIWPLGQTENHLSQTGSLEGVGLLME